MISQIIMTWQCSWVWGGWFPGVQWGWWDVGGWGGGLDSFNAIISIGKTKQKLIRTSVNDYEERIIKFNFDIFMHNIK